MCGQLNLAPRPQTNPKLPAGKIPAALLADLVERLPTDHPQLLLGPAVGEDAAVIDLVLHQDVLLVVKSDPITFASDAIGYYAVNVCANDLAVTGATPLFYLPTIFFPDGSADEGTVRNIFGQIGDACRNLDVVVAGGHSEITPAVNQPVVAGTMLGTVSRGRQVSSGGCQVGDWVLMAGSAPIEGTSLIAREKRPELLAAGWPAAELDQAANYLVEPGISVLKAALLAAEHGLVTAMHDPTEGGIATGLLELSLAGSVGMEIDLDAIPVPALATQLCTQFGLDPLGVIASGALVATAAPDRAADLQRLWHRHTIPSAVIGRILPLHAGVYGLRAGNRCPLPLFAADEITKLWNSPND